MSMAGSTSLFTERRHELERQAEAFNQGVSIGYEMGIRKGKEIRHAHQWNKLFWVVLTAALIGTTVAIILVRI